MFGSVPATLAPSLGVPNAPGVIARETGDGKDRRTILEFKDFVVTGVDNTVGEFCFKVYDLPAAAVAWLGGIVDLALVANNPDGNPGVSSTFTGLVALGSTVGSGATLTTTEADLVPSTVVPAAVAGASTAKAVSTTAALIGIHPGGVGAKAVFLNVIVDAAKWTTGHVGQLVLNGRVTFNWQSIGAYGTLA